jgi:hypothetical protein
MSQVGTGNSGKLSGAVSKHTVVAIFKNKVFFIAFYFKKFYQA